MAKRRGTSRAIAVAGMGGCEDIYIYGGGLEDDKGDFQDVGGHSASCCSLQFVWFRIEFIGWRTEIRDLWRPVMMFDYRSEGTKGTDWITWVVMNTLKE